MQTSILHVHSAGTVTSVPAIGSKVISVRLKERKFGNQDELLDAPTKENVKFAGPNGMDELEVTHTDSVPATWFNRNSNRTTAPNVRRGDEVLVWRVGETDQYLWELRDGKNIRLETVIYAFSADPSKPIADDYSNAYTFEVSSHNKSVTFSTSKANGEPFAFTTQYDLATGQLVNTDDVGNSAYIVSRERIVGMTNGDGSKFEINGPNIIGECKDNAVLTAESISLKADSINLDASSVDISASSVGVSAGTIGLKGNVSIAGAVGVQGSLKLNGRNVKTE